MIARPSLVCWRHLRNGGWAVLLLGLGLRAEADFSNLRDHSPFEAEVPGHATQDPAGDFEFRGYVYSNEGVSLSISRKDQAGQWRSAWVAVNESSDDFVVRAFDPRAETVLLEQRGKNCLLGLKRARAKASVANESAEAGLAAGQAVTPDEQDDDAEVRRELANETANEIGRSRARRLAGQITADPVVESP